MAGISPSDPSGGFAPYKREFLAGPSKKEALKDLPRRASQKAGEAWKETKSAGKRAAIGSLTGMTVGGLLSIVAAGVAFFAATPVFAVPAALVAGTVGLTATGFLGLSGAGVGVAAKKIMDRTLRVVRLRSGPKDKQIQELTGQLRAQQKMVQELLTQEQTVKNLKAQLEQRPSMSEVKADLQRKGRIDLETYEAAERGESTSPPPEAAQPGETSGGNGTGATGRAEEERSPFVPEGEEAEVQAKKKRSFRFNPADRIRAGIRKLRT